MLVSLGLSNFRNYDILSLDFDSKINLFIGENAQGKTNLLESIYFLSFLRSFRTNLNDVIKKINTSSFYISGKLDTNSESRLLELTSGEKKILKVDGISVKKASDFIGYIKPVVFTHEDIGLISSSARFRRRYIDMLISSIDKGYMSDLNEYITALKARNFAIRNYKNDVNLIKAYEPILAKYGLNIIKARYSIIEELKKRADFFIKKIKGKNTGIEISYSSRVKHDITLDNYIGYFNSDRDRDITRQYTAFGPHSDDMNICVNNISLKNYGSVGQCRLAVLCIKMAESEIVSESINTFSAALIDDVTGELDSKTKDSFYSVVDKFSQIFFTLTKQSSDSILKSAASYFISGGNVIR